MEFVNFSSKLPRFGWTVCIALSCLATPVFAQPAPSADDVLKSAADAVRQVDEDRAGELWEAAPAFVKQAKPKSQFIAEVRRAREFVGTVSQREWVNVARFTFPQGSSIPPPGTYATVDFEALSTDGKVAREKLSFRREPAGWRLMGYVSPQLEAFQGTGTATK